MGHLRLHDSSEPDESAEVLHFPSEAVAQIWPSDWHARDGGAEDVAQSDQPSSIQRAEDALEQAQMHMDDLRRMFDQSDDDDRPSAA